MAMKLKENLIRRIDRLMYRTWQEDEGSTRTWHSGFYHNFFEGYRENQDRKKNGKHGRVKRVYSGIWYLASGNMLQLVFRKALYALLTVGAIALYAASCFTEQIAANYSTIVSLIQTVDIFLFLWLIYLCAASVFCGRKMTRSEYKTSHIRMMQVSAAGSLALAVTGAAKMLYAFFAGTADVIHIQNAALLLIGAVLLLAVYLLEGSSRYDTQESEHAEDAGFEIS